MLGCFLERGSRRPTVARSIFFASFNLATTSSDEMYSRDAHTSRWHRGDLGGSSPARVGLAMRNVLTLLPRLRALDLPRCTDSTAYTMLLTAHAESNSSSTELSRHGTWIKRVETQLRLLQPALRSLRIAESLCRRDVLLLVDQSVHQLLTECTLSRCQQIRRFKAWADREGLLWKLVPSVSLDVPAADRINAFTFAAYRYIVSLDADILVLRDMAELFSAPVGRRTWQQELIMAHHPYDLIQGKHCGIPLARRGVGALVGFAPNASAFDSIFASIQALCGADGDHKICLRYSEQLILACHFHAQGRLNTLPCSYLYDLSFPRYRSMRAHGTRNCITHGKVGWRGCREVAEHVQKACLWPQTYRDVHAVHFKGKIKPWHIGGKESCRGHMHQGRLMLDNLPPTKTVVSGAGQSTSAMATRERVGNGGVEDTVSGPYTGADILLWNSDSGACMSQRRGLRVRWADGSLLARECCDVNIALAVEYRVLRADYCSCKNHSSCCR